jgi:UDP-glucuronate 4-epimerase
MQSCPTILVTGAAGFIGMHATESLINNGFDVIGVDNLNDYYSVPLKRSRLKHLEASDRFRFIPLDITDREGVESLFNQNAISTVVHLAAQPGVRYSLKNPHAYADVNLTGFLNILDATRRKRCDQFIYASSSSVYGATSKPLFSVGDRVDTPISLYAATKRANELMAHSYSHLYGLRTVGLRFFTVYGPWGRPDMAPMIFTDAIAQGKPITMFNHGNMLRDFTYISDVVHVISEMVKYHPLDNSAPLTGHKDSRYRLYNVGNSSPVQLREFIAALEEILEMKAIIQHADIQSGDVVATAADSRELAEDFGFSPKTPIRVGLRHMVAWYRQHSFLLQRDPSNI